MPKIDFLKLTVRYVSEHSFLLYCLVIGALLGATSFDLQIVQPSIDSSYTILHNSLFRGESFSSDVALTYGPLGFLVHALDFAYFKYLAIAANTILGMLTGYLSYLFLSKSRPLYMKYSILFLAVLVMDFQLYEWKLFSIYLLGAYLVYRHDSVKWFYLLAATAPLLLYVKLSLGVAVICTIVAIGVLRQTKTKEILYTLAAATGSLVLGGLLFFRSIELPLSYLRHGLPMSADYSWAMSSGPADWQRAVTYLIIGLILTLTATFVSLPRAQRKFILVFLIGVFFVWKAAITRQDIYGHVEALPYFGCFLLIFSVLVVLFEAKKPCTWTKYAMYILSIMGCGFMFLGVHVNGLPPRRIAQTVSAPLTFWKLERCQLAPCRSESQLFLPVFLRREIGRSSVDVYPWESLFAYANNLNWQPRPVPASYTAYAPSLDADDTAYLNSNKAPAYIIWDVREGVNGIDGRHIFFDEPLSLQTILSNYKPVAKTDSVILLKRQSNISVQLEKTSRTFPINWNTWENVPSSTSGVDLVEIRYKPDNKQKIGAIIFRPNPVVITVKKKNGLTYEFRIVVQNASEGLMLNQLPTDTNELMEVLKEQSLANPVTQVKFESPPTGTLSITFATVKR